MKKEYEYEIEEWSVDTRKWVMTSDKQLTEEQISEFSMKHSQWSQNSNANYDTHDVDDDLPF